MDKKAKTQSKNELTGRKPSWLKITAFSGKGYERVRKRLKEYGLSTVCQGANCPNRGECFNRGTATFLIMGSVCTRNCRFCDIKGGTPVKLDSTEPNRLAKMAAELDLKHVVVTSVTRDDLPDGGAGHFASTIEELRRHLPEATIEILTPDFKGDTRSADKIISAGPDVFNHNVETVPRLYSSVRPGARYDRSLDLLKYVAENSDIATKSGIMVGMGESLEEIGQVVADLAAIGVRMLTIGQYLQPSKEHLPVVRFVHPDEFEDMRILAEEAGILRVVSGPLVRSSYRAEMI